MRNLANRIIILKNFIESKFMKSLISSTDSEQNMALFLNQLYSLGYENNLMDHICRLILLDENVFSYQCANHSTPSDFIKRAYLDDLSIVEQLVMNLPNDNRFYIGSVGEPFTTNLSNVENISNLQNFYSKYGFGSFIQHSTYHYTNEQLMPITSDLTETLCQLKNYATEKQLIDTNITNFLKSLPYHNMLLYGDKGTGKSSTIHAFVQQYFDQGLRLIEIKKEQILDIPKIRQSVRNNPLKFILLIDDLSFGEYDDQVSSLKASLEGSATAQQNNTMIVATSNRRHIVKESFSDRNNSVHTSDSIQEQLSLSDRFGLTIMFSTTDKAEYLSILQQLASDYHLKISESDLNNLGERYALSKGGRSPRRAKQLIELIYSAEKRNIPIDF